MLTLILVVACASPAPTPAAPAPAPPAPAPAPPADNAASPPPKGFVCCADPGAQALLDAYLPIQRALEKGDTPAAVTAAAALATAADTAGAAEIAALARSVAGTDLKAVRNAFAPLSAAMITHARAHVGGTTTIAEAFCPMAPGGWLQTEGAIRNPYYGDEMLTCGSFR